MKTLSDYDMGVVNTLEQLANIYKEQSEVHRNKAKDLEKQHEITPKISIYTNAVIEGTVSDTLMRLANGMVKQRDLILNEQTGEQSGPENDQS